MLRFPGLVGLFWAACVLPALASPGVEWVVRSNGFPGTRAGSTPAPQLLSARGSRLRILDPAQARVVYLDLEAERWVEGQPLARSYQVTPFQQVEARRARELANRARTAAQLARRRDRLLERDEPEAARDLERDAARVGLRLDGRPDEVGLEHVAPDRRAVVVHVDGRPRQLTLEHYRVRINQAAEPAVDLWVTADLALPLDLLTFYRATGLFHPGVAQRLAEVPGVVIEARARLRQGALERVVTTEVLRVRTQARVRDADLARPPGWTEVGGAAQADDPPADDARCAHCGEAFAGQIYRGWGRTFCSPAHRVAGFAGRKP